ncbi:flavin-containing monooxygenase [Peribacillus sp. FSL M8-0224]|uniref:flavin-containing monooxygenase n=1 Tax=Peribacillus sp. FSL M8-0224 TaxID=2921568 RepID=UPI0030FB2B7C
MKNHFDSIVIGAGQAGLASAYHLQKQGLTYLVLETDNQIAGSWSKYYDSLKLFSPARYSSLPKLRFPGDSSRYPSKDEVISYLNEYAKHFNLNIRTGEKVTVVRKVSGVFTIVTARGNVFYTKTVISAAGAFAYPNLPLIEGSDRFKGKIIHSSQYKNVDEYKNKRVVVVGGGNSAVQIAFELAKVSKVSLATRKPISFKPQRILGKDIHFWLKITGFDTLFYGRKFAMDTSVMDTGIYKEAILKNKIECKNMFINYTEEGIVWSDGRREKVDSVIYATGYRPHVSYLTSLKNAIGSNGSPLQNKGISTTIDGLYFVGISGQRSFSSATIRGVGVDAKYVIKEVKKLIKDKGN